MRDRYPELPSRQLRRGKSLEASRDRAALADPHPLLPPLWVLQAGDGAALQTRIAELGGDPDAVALGFEGDHDCYVLGGRSNIVPAETQETLRKTLPRVRIETIAGTGHYPSDEKPAEFLAIVDRFLADAP